MTKPSHLQSVLNCFINMDIDGLEALLSDKYVYEDTTKEIFLKEINSIFKSHRGSKDTKLVVFTGKCASKTCDNCGNKGYRFAGNYTWDYLDLIFELEGDEITGICACENFYTDEHVEDFDTKADITINLDDRVSFVKTPDYFADLNATMEAQAELESALPDGFDLDDLTRWTEKYRGIYQKLGGFDFTNPPMRWTGFLMEYQAIKGVVDFVRQNISLIQQANKTIPQTTENELDLIEWIIEYEQVWNAAPVEIRLSFVKEGKSYFMHGGMWAKGNEFLDTIRFSFFYMKHHYQLMQKYRITTEDLEIPYNLKTESWYKNWRKQDTISYQLELRKRLEASGINVPLYMGRNIPF